MNVTPKYMTSLIRDWVLWTRCGKSWPSSALPSSDPLHGDSVEPPTVRKHSRRKANTALSDVHTVRSVFDPSQKSSRNKTAGSKSINYLNADVEVEKLDQQIRLMPWHLRLVIIHTYLHPNFDTLTTRQVGALIYASHNTAAKALAEAIDHLVERWNKGITRLEKVG